MGLYSKDTATKMDLVVADGANGGLKGRTQYIKESKLVEVSRLLHCNLVNSDRLLLNGFPLKIVLHRQRDSFVLMADDASKDCRVCITEAQFCVLHANLSNKKMQEHSTILTTYTILLFSQLGGYEDTLHSARNIKFTLGECSCGSITKQSVQIQTV